MKRHLTNAGYGVLDYISYPVGMLLVAPLVLRKAGAAEYGLWMISTAIISAGGIIASGFCDAGIQRIAQLRGTGEFKSVPETVRSMLGINVALGALLALGAWCAAPLAARHIAIAQLTPPNECLIALRVASAAILLRAIESVAVSAQRAFEQYRGTVQISAAMRVATLAAAAAIASLGGRTVAILLATCVFLVLAAAAQFLRLRNLTGSASFWPRFHVVEAQILLGRGFFTWLQAFGGVVFGQLDRILLGISLGALVVTPYSLCVQFAHPIYGLSASGLNFLFPYLSCRAGTVSNGALGRSVLKAFACNLAMVIAGASLLLLVGGFLIRIWAGPAVAESARSILPPIVAGSALVGLSITGSYTLQALGDFHTVAAVSLGGRAAMLPLMIEMLHRHALYGLAMSRLCYGAIALIVYLPLLRRLRAGSNWRKHVSPLAIPIEAQEASEP